MTETYNKDKSQEFDIYAKQSGSTWSELLADGESFTIDENRKNDAKEDKHLAVGTVTIGENVPALGWDLTRLECSNQIITFVPGTSEYQFELYLGDKVVCTFTNTERSTVTVHKYHDLDQDGKRSNDDPPLEGWEFTINGHNPEVTDANGEAFFAEVKTEKKDYTLTETVQEGWLVGNFECSVDGKPLLGKRDKYESYMFNVNPGVDIECEVGNYQDAELLIEKTNDQIGNILTSGDTVIFEITVTNPDTSGIVYDALVYDLLPDGLEYVGGTWSAISTVRGDITGSEVPEPDYTTQAAAQWKLGNLAVGEVVTLTYQVVIADTVSDGTYENVAYVAGDACSVQERHPELDNEDELWEDPCPGPYQNMLEQVLGNLVDGEGDPFVESAIEVANPEEPEQGFVLGTLSVTGTPAILSPVIGLLLTVSALAVSRRKKYNFSKWFREIGRSSATLLLGVVLATSLLVTQAFATSRQLTVSELAGPTKLSALTLDYSVATTDNTEFTTVTLDVDGPGSNDYQVVKTAVGGSHGGNFTLNMPVDGDYKVTVSTDTGSAPNMQTVTKDSEPPVVPIYSGVVRSGNTYTLTFSADSSATKILIYSSTATEFPADGGTLIGEVPATATSFVFVAPDGNQRYFAIQTVDVARNVSGLVGDELTVVTVVSSNDSTSSGSSFEATNDDNEGTVSDDGASTATGVEGATDESSGVDSDAAADESDDIGSIVAVSGIILFVMLIGAAYFVITTNRGKQE